MDTNWGLVKSYITPGIALTEVNVCKNNGLVLYWMPSSTAYGNEDDCATEFCNKVGVTNPERTVRALSRTAVETYGYRNGIQYDFVLIVNSKREPFLFTTINWIRQYPIAPINANKGSFAGKITRMAHLLIISNKAGLCKEVYRPIADIVQHLNLSLSQIYLSSEIHSPCMLTAGVFDRSNLFYNDLEEKNEI